MLEFWFEVKYTYDITDYFCCYAPTAMVARIIIREQLKQLNLLEKVDLITLVSL